MLRALPLAMLLATLLPQAASACTCMISQDPYGFSASALFAGRVTRVEAKGEWGPVEVEFDVDRAWRGPITPTVVAGTGFGGGDCGYQFQVGEAYLVPAHVDSEGAMWTGLCSGVMEKRHAGEVLLGLGEGWEPTLYDAGIPFWDVVEPYRTSRWKERLLVAYSLLAALILSGLGWRLWRVRSDPL